MGSIVSSIVRVRSVVHGGGGHGGGGVDPALTALKAAAISLWTLNESSGDFVDLIGSNDLVESGTLTRGSGKVGNAITSTAATNYASVTSAELTPADTSYWFAAWVKINDISSQQFVMGTLTGGAADGWGIRTKFDAPGVSQMIISKSGSFENITIGDGTDLGWHLCIAGYEHSAQKVWASFDGGAISEAARTAGLGAPGMFQLFGTDFISVLNASLDEVGVYSGARATEAMIAALWNGGAGISNNTIAAA